ncbi:integrase [Pseudomonas putida]
MAKVTAFLSKLDLDRSANLLSLEKKAKALALVGFDKTCWEKASWMFTAGPLTKLSAKRSGSPSVYFRHAPKIGALPLEGDWDRVAKAIFSLRLHRSNQKISNHQTFVTAISYVSHCVGGSTRSLAKLMPEDLEEACALVTNHYMESTAYNIHKAIAEFAAHCDANKLCNVRLEYKYSGLKRPNNASGLTQRRLDDPQVLQATAGDRIVDMAVFKLIGMLYQKVPKDHKYRIYILMLVMLSCLGRRFSEISTLPIQVVSSDAEGRRFLRYFTMKTSLGDNLHPIDKVWLPSESVPILEDVVEELEVMTRLARSTAVEMRRTNGPDLRWLAEYPDKQRLYIPDLEKLGLSGALLSSHGWLEKNGLNFQDPERLTSQGKRPANPFRFTTKIGLISYCRSTFDPRLNEPVRIATDGRNYYQEDMLFIRHARFSSTGASLCVVTTISHSMFSTFLRHLESLAAEYGDGSVKPNFSSHDFRHTINTLLYEGGMSDFVQTKWFGRRYANDTKAYQHTSRERRALLYQQKIRQGKIGGPVAENYVRLPVPYQEAYLKAKITGVHDVGTGMCTRNLSQAPCPNHLECHAKCSDFSWEKNDMNKREGILRAYKVEVINYQNAIAKSKSVRPGESNQWIAHSKKKIETLTAMLDDYSLSPEHLVKVLAEKNLE